MPPSSCPPDFPSPLVSKRTALAAADALPTGDVEMLRRFIHMPFLAHFIGHGHNRVARHALSLPVIAHLEASPEFISFAALTALHLTLDASWAYFDGGDLTIISILRRPDTSLSEGAGYAERALHEACLSRHDETIKSS